MSYGYTTRALAIGHRAPEGSATDCELEAALFWPKSSITVEDCLRSVKWPPCPEGTAFLSTEFDACELSFL